MWRIFCGILIFGLVACGGAPKEKVTAKDFREKWPLTVTEGELTCESGSVLFVVSGQKYAVNGTAQDKRKELPSIDQIWKASSTTPGAKADISPLLTKGLALCK